jgi:cyclophilin family peptidyl-prolyl cis-trans isomerase
MWQRWNRLTAGVLAAVLVCLASGPNAAAQAQGPFVVLQTTKGPIVMKIFYNYVPNTAGNFLDLVSRGFYNGLTFHRVEGWVIQGGDPNGNGTGDFIDPATGRPRYLMLETNRFLKHNAPGVVAMAHAKNPNSGSCQFYITKKAMPALDGQYSIFGGVVKGMEVVYAIQPGDRIISAEIIQPAGGGGGGPAPGARGAGRMGEPQPAQPVGDSGF